MIIKNTKFILLFLFFIGLTTLLVGQEDDTRLSEADISIEDRFVQVKLLAAMGKRAEAIKNLDTLRRQSAPNAAIYFELAKLHYDAKDYNLTESNLKSAINLAPDNIWIRSFEAQFATDLGRYDPAINALEVLSTLRPKNPEYYDQIVQLKLRKQDINGALNTLDLKEQSIGFSQSNIIKKAEILDQAGRVDESINVLNTLVQKYPKEKKYLRMIIHVLHSNDKISASAPYMKRILEIDPSDQYAKFGLLMLSKKSLTEDDFMVSLYPMISNPEVPIDLKVKELLPLVQKHADTADTLLGKQLITLCDQLVIAHPIEAKAHAIYADVLKNDGKIIAAIRQYERTLELNKKVFVVWEQLMYALDEIDNPDQLQNVATDAIDYFPNQPISYYFLAKSWINKSEFKRANELLDEASLIAAGNKNIESRILTARAEISFRKKDFKNAMDEANQAIELSNGKNTTAIELKGDIYQANGDLKNALLMWKDALKNGGSADSLLPKINSPKNN
ncbi:MAG: tetratricopeptide repeat protein [Saprospiraceae bacterium]